MLDLNICTFKELIECAFGDSETNAVNFKTIQTILHLLARQMGVLDRLVQIDFVSEHSSANLSSITVSEIKIKPASGTKKIKSKNVYKNEREIRRTEEILGEKNIFNNQTLVKGEKNIQTQPTDFKRDFITQGWPYNPSLDYIGIENYVDSWKTLPTSTKKTISIGSLKTNNQPSVNKKLSEHKLSTTSSGGVFIKMTGDKFTKSQSVLKSETLSKKGKKYAKHSIIQDLFHQRPCAQESVSEEENHQEYPNTKHDIILSPREKNVFNINVTSGIIKDTQIDENEKLYQKEEYKKKDVQNLYTVITVTKNLENTIQRSSKQSLIFKDGSVNDINLSDSNSFGQKYLGEPDPPNSATMDLTKKTYEQSMSKLCKQRQALFSKSPRYATENLDSMLKFHKQRQALLSKTQEYGTQNPYLFSAKNKVESKINEKREETSNKGEKMRTNQLNEKNTLMRVFLTYVDSLGEIVSIGEINEDMPKTDYLQDKSNNNLKQAEETNRDRKENRIGQSKRPIQPIQPTDYLESSELKKFQDHKKTTHRSSSENMILTGYEDGNLILGYENEAQTHSRSEDGGRKNSKYQQFYGSSTEELISKYEEIFRGPKTIRSQSDPLDTVQTLRNKLHYQTSREIIFKRDETPEIVSGENRNAIDKKYETSNFPHEKTKFHSDFGEISIEENKKIQDKNFFDSGSTKKISVFPHEKQQFQSHLVEVSLKGTRNGKDKNFSDLVRTKKTSTFPHDMKQFQFNSDEISIEENENGIQSAKKSNNFPHGKMQFRSKSVESSVDGDRSVQARLVATPTDWSFITENATSKYKEITQAIMSKSPEYQSSIDIGKYLAMKDSILSKSLGHYNIDPKKRSRSSSGALNLTKQILGYDEQGMADNGPLDIKNIINKRNLTPFKLDTSAQKGKIEGVKDKETDDIKHQSDDKKLNDRINDRDKFGARNFIGDLKDTPNTDPSDFGTEKTRLYKTMLKEERNVYYIEMQNDFDNEELQLKYQRQRDAILSKCRSGIYQQESFLPRDDSLFTKRLKKRRKKTKKKRKKRKFKSASSKELRKRKRKRHEIRSQRQGSGYIGYDSESYDSGSYDSESYDSDSYSSDESSEVKKKKIGSRGKLKKGRSAHKTKMYDEFNGSDGKLKSGTKLRKKDKYEDSSDESLDAKKKKIGSLGKLKKGKGTHKTKIDEEFNSFDGKLKSGRKIRKKYKYEDSSDESSEAKKKKNRSLGKLKKGRGTYKTKIDEEFNSSDDKLKSGKRIRKKDKYEDSEDIEHGYTPSVKEEREMYSPDDTINKKRTNDELKERKKEIKKANDEARRDIVEQDEDDSIGRETAKKRGKKKKHDSNEEKIEKDVDKRKKKADEVMEDINNLKNDLLKSGIDSGRQEPIEEYPYSKDDGITSGYLPEADQKDAKGKEGGVLDKSKDFDDSGHLKSPSALIDSYESKDTETKKDADGRKDSAKAKDIGPTSPDLDQPKNADQLKDSIKLKDSAKLQDSDKSSDSKKYDDAILQDTDKLSDSKKYDDPNKSKKVRQQSAAISDGTEGEYVKHAASEDLLASGGPMGTKGGKKLDIHGVPLEVFEELREQELRVINQRADSREEPDREPTRMLSVQSAEKALAHSTKEGQKVKAGTKAVPGKSSKRTSGTDSRRTSQDIEEEKILVVERIPLDKEKAREYKEKHKDTPLAIVRLEEFQELAKEVKELEARLRPASKYSLPGNAELLELIRNGASLTEAMAALQLSARIEAAENALENIVEMVAKLAAQNPDIDIDIHGQPIVKATGRDEIYQAVGGVKCREECVTKPELDQELLKVQMDLAKEISETAKKNLSKIDMLAKNLKGLESRVEDVVHMSNRITDLEESVSGYSERINAMDTGLSVQMTSYQDQLTQMQHELEEGLENMAETLANAEGDPAAVSELHAKFNILQDDLINTTNIQSELEKNERDVFVNLKDIFIQIEHLRETKADREEVEDALQNKAGLSALNGLISLEHFNALIDDVENHIGSAYDKFNNQELIWQKAINDLVKELNEKTNLDTVISLRDDINTKLNVLMDKINSVREIVGEPKAFGISKQINVGTECLSCKTPAQMEPEDKPTRLPPLKSSPTAAGGALRKEAGDACYPGLPIPHPLDPRSHICNRYCGGSHTMVKNVVRAKSVTGALTLKKMDKPIKTEAGTDGKAYLVEDPGGKIPCVPCNIVPSVSGVNLGRKPSAPVKGRAVFNIEVRECDKCSCFNGKTSLDSNLTLN